MVTIALAASFLAEHYSAPAMLYALLLGLALNFLYDEKRSVAGIDFSAGALLRIGIVLLGLRIGFMDVRDVGWEVLSLIVVGILTTFCVGIIGARVLGLSRMFGLISGGAVAICGASAALAIAAVLPGKDARQRDAAFVIIGVTGLSTLAMIFYPLLGSLLSFGDEAMGVFLGATVHDVAQVVGAGFSVSSDTGERATLVKLIRVAMLVPVILSLSLIHRGGADAAEGKGPALPGFLLGFVGLVLVGNLVTLPQEFLKSAESISRFCLVAAIAAIGLRSNLRGIATVGASAGLLLLLETCWLSILVLTSIHFGLSPG